MKDKLRIERSAGVVAFRREGSQIYYLLLQYPRGKQETDISKIRFFPGYKETQNFRYQWPPGSADAEPRLKFVVFYLGQVFTRAVKISHEHKDFRWVSYERAYRLLKHKNIRSMLKKAHELLIKKSL